MIELTKGRWKALGAVCALLAMLQIATAATPQAPRQAAVASAHYLATEAGHEVMAAGGNAFDAAVAVAAALAVVEPSSSGLGGGAFFLIHRASDQRQVMIDARETAPGDAHRDMYLDEAGEVNRDLAVNGPLAAGIPGHPAGLVHLAENYGRLPLKQSLAPAIRLASEGFPVDEKYYALLNFRKEVMLRWPAASEIFLEQGEVPAIGSTIVNADIARTLKMLAEHGHDGFYRSEFSQRLAAGVRAAGGIWKADDLAAYTVKERQPITINYHGYRLITAPPPSSGGIALAEILNIVEAYPLAEMQPVQRTHILVEAMRRAYRDRSIYLGDTDFVEVPQRLLTSEDYAAGLRASIRLDQATPSDMLAGFDDAPKGTDTTHFSLIDRDGNMVAATLTVNLPYGSAFMVPGTGFLLNNEMDDFSAKAGAPNAFGLLGYSANAIEPGKRMLSSMSPTIVQGPDRVAVLGTPGGSRIITMVLLGVLDFIAGNGPESWVALPRFHHQYQPDVISFEPDAFSEAEVEALRELGHDVQPRNRTWGNMHGVMWRLDDGAVSAGSDPRWPSGRAIVR
ncbi:MAG: gamma-glutamyltransferase [Wenzhouxiangellaceae bacterium]